MRRKTRYLILAAEAVALMAFAAGGGAWSVETAAFPFAQIASVLRKLSLGGRMGNGLAMVLLAASAGLPLLFLQSRKAGRAERVLLAVTAGVIAYVLYSLADPARMLARFPQADGKALPLIRSVYGITAWSFLACCVVLHLPRLLQKGKLSGLYLYSRRMLCVLAAAFTAVLAASCFASLLNDWQAAAGPADRLLAVVRFATSSLPFVMDLAGCLKSLDTVDALLADQRQEAALAAERLSGLCCRMLAWISGAEAGLNVLQLILAPSLSNVSVVLNLPVLSLAFVPGILLLARFIAENGRLAAENESFI